MPIGPVNKRPIGTRLRRPSRMFWRSASGLFDLFHAADDFEAVLGLDEFDQAVALALDDPRLRAAIRRSTSRRASPSLAGVAGPSGQSGGGSRFWACRG